MKSVVVALSVAAMDVAFGTAEADERVCRKEESVAAEREALYLTNWTMVYKSYLKYAHCDQASIAEGYNESIGRLLADDWRSVGMVGQLSRKSRGFEDFVVRHVGESTLPEHAKSIQENAQRRCPPGYRELCKRLIDALQL